MTTATSNQSRGAAAPASTSEKSLQASVKRALRAVFAAWVNSHAGNGPYPSL